MKMIHCFRKIHYAARAAVDHVRAQIYTRLGKRLQNKWNCRWRKWKTQHEWYRLHYNLTQNKDILTAEEKAEIHRFWARYYPVDTTCHAFYKEITGTFSPAFLPDGVYYTIVDQFYNNEQMAYDLDNKCLYERLFPGIRHPKKICYRANGFWFDAADTPIDVQRAYGLVSAEEAVFIKEAQFSNSGLGVSYYRGSDSTVEAFQSLTQRIGCDIVIQEAVKQCAELNKLNSHCVNTVRLMTLLEKNGRVSVCSAILRTGVGKSKVDNAHSGGLSAGVTETGQVRPYAYHAPGGARYTEHPDTHVRFSDIVIPNYAKMKEAVCRLHVLVPHFRLISWDIAVGEDHTPILIEANLRCGGLDVHQFANGPLFGERTAEVLDEVFHKA